MDDELEMISDILKIYKIGKELGLTNKEITNALFDRKKISIILFYLIIIILISFWAISIVILHVNISRNTYPAGTMYSSVKIGYFRKGRKNLKEK